ncbi:MAG: PTS sugar transporter subunit IIA [Gemmatimonadota bacterium]|nr:PTS sugar transporter subunit IIA [Gemmatimonadota bacterium]
MRIKDFLRPDFVVLRLESDEPEGIIHEVARRAEEAGIGPSHDIQEKLLEREVLHPTVMGQGLAIPHATVPGLSDPVIGVAMAADRPIRFGTPEMDPVLVFFILLTPPGREREHVKLLARICRLGREHGFIDELHEAPDVPTVLKTIHEIDARHV